MNDSWIKKLFKTNLEDKQVENKNDNNNEHEKVNNGMVITIGRELGSAGRKVAKEVAKKLNYTYYDKEIITKAAKESGIDENLFSQVDEADLDSFWFEFSANAYKETDNKNTSFKEMTAADKLFMIQSDTIRNVASKGGCVIVGRCATYILKNASKRIFICADEKDRIERIKRSYKVSEKEAKEIMLTSDKKRENYHSYYTNQNWKDKNGYDLVINTSEYGVDGAVKKIIELLKT